MGQQRMRERLPQRTIPLGDRYEQAAERRQHIDTLLRLRRMSRPALQTDLDHRVPAVGDRQVEPGRLRDEADVRPHAAGTADGLAETVAAPRLASSSSATSASTSRPGAPAATSCSAAITSPATPPFMSLVPRPNIRSPSILAVNGSAMPSTPTVSRCPFSTTVRPGRPPSAPR